MPHSLKNDLIEVQLHLPTETYNHSRFDWSGKIAAVKFKGKFISGNEKIDQRDDQLFGKGFYNEFGIDSPLGFDEIETGEWFHKIGVGLLKKNSEQYDFRKHYEIRPADFDLIPGPDKIKIQCQSQLVNGYCYRLEKAISLAGSGFKIEYRLENKGSNPIITNEYSHNFLSVNRELIGSNYRFRFPFEIKPHLFGEDVNPERLVEFGQKEIRLTGTPKNEFFFSNLSGGEMVDARFDLTDLTNKIRISETGDFQTNSINLWGAGHVICPELFIDINIPAGQSMTWSRSYSVREID